jgi:hypothetical protein
MFVLLPWLRSCICLIVYVTALTANSYQNDNGGKIEIPIFLSLIGPNPDG